MAGRRRPSPVHATPAFAGPLAAVSAEQANTAARSRLTRLDWRRLGRLAGASSWLARVLERPWVAYPGLILLQLKVVWGDWDYRDLTPGDTADYFVFAYGWFTRLTVEFARSPAYTAFYGTLLHLSTDAAVVTYLHRLLIVLAGDVLLLALLRRLLPAGIAWLVAGWWTLLVGNFDVMYEVHLFGLLPLLLAALVAAGVPSSAPHGRGTALAILLAGVLLVRNELVVPFAGLLAVCLVYEVRRLRQTRSRRRTLLAYAGPLALVLLVTLGFYLRSTVRYPALLEDLRAKHTLNVCQVYAFAYAEQHPEWSASPWTECDSLMQQTFGQPRPTLVDALRTNPAAMLREFVWNARLARAGLEFALFNAASNVSSPDFSQVRTGEPLPRVLGVGLFLVMLGGAVCFVRDRRLRVGQPVWGWVVLVAGGLGAGVVLLIERPRAEYVYGLTILLMAAAGWSVAVLARRWAVSSRWLSTAVGLAVCGLAVWPGYYAIDDHVGRRDLLETFQRLRPFSDLIADPNTRMLKGDYNAAVAAYLGHRAEGVLDYSLLEQRDPSLPLAEFLDQRGITLVYLDDTLLNSLEADEEHPEPLVEAPESVGWRLVAFDDTPEARWRLLERTSGPSVWGERRDSNARPSGPQPDALTD